jgi:hypothetical protein
MTYKIGTTLVGMVTLASLGVPDPKSTYEPYSEQLELGNGKIRGGGFPTATWHWGFLKQAWRDALRAYCTGASASIFIETRITDTSDAYDQFSVVIVWPQEEERDAFRRLDFTLEFRQLVTA